MIAKDVGARTLIIVCGMHRSGTSAFTRVLNIAGGSLPHRLAPPAPDNPSGFWESPEVVAINDRLLQALGRSWDDPREMPPSWTSHPAFIEAVEAAIDVLRLNAKGSSILVLKDPRISRTLPVWLAASEQAGMSLRVLLAIRNPLEVADSLAKRNKTPILQSLSLWLRYMVEAEHHSREIPRAFISYASFLENPTAVLKKLEKKWGVNWTKPWSKLNDRVREFLAPELRHSHYTYDDLLKLEGWGGWLAAAFTLFEQFEEFGQDPSWYARMDQLAAEIGSICDQPAQLGTDAVQSKLESGSDVSAFGIHQGGVAANLVRLESRVYGFNERLNSFEDGIALAGRRVASVEGRLVACEQHLSESIARLDQTRAEISNLDDRMGHVEVNLTRRLNDLDRQAMRLEAALVGLASVTTGRASRETVTPLIRRLAGAALRLNIKETLREENAIAIIAASGLFNQTFYMSRNPDVATLGMDPIVHYVRYGATEARNPNPSFDTAYYLHSNPDVARSGMNPLVHFIVHGTREGRRPNPDFDPVAHADRHPEIRLTEINPLLHFMLFGENSPPQASDALETERPFPWLSPGAQAVLVEHLRRYDLTNTANDTTSSVWTPEAAQRRLEKCLASPRGGPVDATIIVPVHNRLRYTLSCLESLTLWPTKYSCEIVVCDDASTDQTRQVLASIHGIRLITTSTNVGFVAACNRAAAEATGQYVLLLNNDTIVLPGWLDELIGTFDLYPQAGLVGCKLLYPDGRLQEAGGIVWADGSAWNYGRLDDPSKPQFDFLRDVDYCSGASIAVRADLWRKLGGFDERYRPAYYEDTDLAFKVREAEFRVLYQPLASLIHFEGVSSGTSVEVGVKRYQSVNRAKFLDRWRTALASHGMPETRTWNFAERRVKRRILVVDATVPTPDRDAGSLITFNYLQILLRQEFHPTFVPENLANGDEYASALRRLGVEFLHWPHVDDLVGAVRRLAPSQDVVLLYRARVAHRLVDAVRDAAPKVPIIFHTVDLHFLREEREAALLGDPESAARAAETRRVELGVIGKSDATILVSRYEVDLVRDQVPSASLWHIPIPHEIPSPPSTAFDDRHDVIFVGGFRHPPNVDAVRFLTNEVWPLVRPMGVDARLVIVGPDAPPEVLAAEAPDITIRGFVPDLASVYAQARLSVAPLRYGAGLKGKIVSSLSHGVPVVATPVAIEGSGLQPEHHVLVGSTPHELADQIHRAYATRDLWHTLSANGLAFARANFSIESVEKELIALFRSLRLL